MSGFVTLLESVDKRENDLYAVLLEGHEIVFRLPSIKQAQQYIKMLSLADEQEQMLLFEQIFRTYLENKGITNEAMDIHAGIPESIAKTILLLSGVYGNVVDYTESLFHIYRAEANTNINFMKRKICEVFPGYTFESIDLLTYQQLVNNFMQAEKVLIERGIIEVPYTVKESPKVAKPKPFRVEDVIKRDMTAHKEFEEGDSNPEAIRRKEQMNKLREDAKRRAEEQERAYKKRTFNQGG